MEKEIHRLARRILKVLGARRAAVRDATLDIFLLPGCDMRALKRRFFVKYSEPNVLSFPEPLHFPHPETKRRYLGEIYLNRDILQQSPERAIPLLLHGILHLFGYDHKKKTDIIKMVRLEKSILENFNARRGMMGECPRHGITRKPKNAQKHFTRK